MEERKGIIESKGKSENAEEKTFESFFVGKRGKVVQHLGEKQMKTNVPGHGVRTTDLTCEFWNK